MRALVAGVGNRYMGDDGFGPRVVERLSELNLPENVEVRDVGLCGFTLAVELDQYDLLVLVDALKMGASAGKIYCEKIEGVIEADLSSITIHDEGVRELLAFAKKIGTLPADVYLVGCEISQITLREGLSPPVEAAVDDAVRVILRLLYRQSEG